MKVWTIKLDPTMIARLQAVALARGTSASHVARIGIEKVVEKLEASPPGAR